MHADDRRHRKRLGRAGSKITFTRSRPYKKNDSAHVEQKNGAIVRQLVGYDRYDSKVALAQLARVYRLVRLHANFFQPVQKLVAKSRNGARTYRRYDVARTPYQRLCDAGVLSAEKRKELEATTRDRRRTREAVADVHANDQFGARKGTGRVTVFMRRQSVLGNRDL